MGRDKRNEQKKEHYTVLVRNFMATPAWRALPSSAQALYPWLRLEWAGDKFNNNGKIKLSVRQAAECMGLNQKTVMRALHALQAKGFIHITEPARLGVTGEARSSRLELTEIPLPGSERNEGRKLYKEWSEGNDFPVTKAAVHNPRGINGKTKPRAQNGNGTVVKMGTKR